MPADKNEPWMSLSSGGPDQVGPENPQGKNRGAIVNALNMPIASGLKDKLNDYLNQHVNVPLSESGHPDLGAAISSTLSSAGEMVIPDSLADAAMMYVPAGKLIKLGKGMSKIVPGLEKAGAIDYAAMKAPEEAASALNREKGAVNANTLKYDKMGNVVEQKAGNEMEYDPDTNQFK